MTIAATACLLWIRFSFDMCMCMYVRTYARTACVLLCKYVRLLMNTTVYFVKKR